MAIPRQSGDQVRARQTAGQLRLFVPATDLLEVEITHEMGRGTDSLEQERVEIVQPSRYPTEVRLKSRVVGDLVRGPGSSSYIAAIRRRKAGNIGTTILALGGQDGRLDFTVFTFPIIESLKSLLKEMLEAELEGNSREILRQVRNTFLDGGWEFYRRADARLAAKKCLDILADADSVSPGDVKEVFRMLTAAKLNPVGMALPDQPQGEWDEDGEGEEVSG